MADIKAVEALWAEETAFFAASNSFKGFHSYFEEIFRAPEVEHLYIIKGGPGTGKSSFMRHIAEEHKKVGADVEYYYCSSDQSSLDGIIVRRNGRCFAVIDGTAPHSFDTLQPGVKDEIINLGHFWDTARLKDSACASEILKLCEEKTRSFELALEYLGAYERVSAAIDSIMDEYTYRDGIKKYAAALIDSLDGVRLGTVSIALIDSIGVHGRIRLCTYERLAKKTVTVRDTFGCGYRLMEQLYSQATERGIAVKVSFDPIIPSKINALLFAGAEVAFCVMESGDEDRISECAENIGTRRFIDVIRYTHDKIRLKRLTDTRIMLRDMALGYFKESSGKHFALEKIYVDAMDFDRLSVYRNSLCARTIEFFG
ncbi:MAG: hypothetical protein IKA82_03660 [Clostridia bacterium]|nr:hypothetical protein [Clostridia bacterium]